VEWSVEPTESWARMSGFGLQVVAILNHTATVTITEFTSGVTCDWFMEWRSKVAGYHQRSKRMNSCHLLCSFPRRRTPCLTDTARVFCSQNVGFVVTSYASNTFAKSPNKVENRHGLPDSVRTSSPSLHP